MIIISYVTLIKVEGNLNNPVDARARAARSPKSRPHTVYKNLNLSHIWKCTFVYKDAFFYSIASLLVVSLPGGRARDVQQAAAAV
jgi:hypothetical protein